MNLSTSPSVIKAHDISRFQFRDTPFVKLMNKRIYNVLFIASQYDMFILEDDGRVDEQIFNEYTSLNLRYPPRFTQVSTADQAMEELRANRYELIICMPNMDNHEIFAQAKIILRVCSRGKMFRGWIMFSAGWEMPICCWPSSN